MPSAPYPARNDRIKNKTPLQIKKAKQHELDAKVQKAFAQAKKTERAQFCGYSKRKPNDHLAQYLALSLKSRYTIRAAEDHCSKSYNLSRQVLALVDHLYVRYPVPLFLYRSMLSHQGMRLVFDVPLPKEYQRGSTPKEAVYRPWFFAAAWGYSFAKETKGTFTKKEAHWFLKAPADNTIGQNIVWAKAAAAGVPLGCCSYLVERLGQENWKQLGDRLPDLLRFYANAWKEMRGFDADEITDFVRAMIDDPDFSFKGRTFGSMRKLCHEWHRTYYSGYIREYVSWTPSLPLWEHRKKGSIIRAIELTNNRALAEEGQKQRHCVYTYTSMCRLGRCRIVSLRWFTPALRLEDPTLELQRLTLEVSVAERQVVQIRGKMNRRATDDEMALIRFWAGEHGLTLAAWI